METPKKVNTKVVMAGIAALVLSVAAVLIMQPAIAQTNSTTSTPELKGSVSIANATNEFVRDNVKVSFNDATSTAQSQVSNGVVIGGKLTIAQGFLVYTFNVANYDAGTSRIVIIDAGNGGVLYTSDEMPLRYGGLGGGFGGCGHHGGYGHWNGKDMTSSSGESSDVETTSA
jgi:uncharacterized membrane protein YkoI